MSADQNTSSIEDNRIERWEVCLGAAGAPGLAEMIAEGCDVNAVTKSRQLPLGRAARSAGPAACRILVDAGALVNAVDPQGITPLHQAIAYHQSETVELLLECGARTDFTPKNPKEDYLTPFQLCVSSGRTEEVARFAASEDLGQRTLQGQTLLQLANTDLSMRQLLRSLKTESSLLGAVHAEAPAESAARAFEAGPL